MCIEKKARVSVTTPHAATTMDKYNTNIISGVFAVFVSVCVAALRANTPQIVCFCCQRASGPIQKTLNIHVQHTHTHKQTGVYGGYVNLNQTQPEYIVTDNSTKWLIIARGLYICVCVCRNAMYVKY